MMMRRQVVGVSSPVRRWVYIAVRPALPLSWVSTWSVRVGECVRGVELGVGYMAYMFLVTVQTRMEREERK